jgi:riboflavin transporter FmnP
MPETKTARIAGTAVLGALVIILDYSLKFSGLKIPFPWLPTLKFDFTGVPIALSLFLYGLPSAGVTSTVAFLGIVIRSGDLVGASMKALAEFSTVLLPGLLKALFPGRSGRLWKIVSLVSGAIIRVVVMTLASLAVFPLFYGVPLVAVVLQLPFIGVFNLVMGCLSLSLGYLVYEAIVRRVPSLVGLGANRGSKRSQQI